jgi:hypothetical protein
MVKSKVLNTGERMRNGIVIPRTSSRSCRILDGTSDDVAQAVAIGQSRESHVAELISATEIAHAMIAAITNDDASKRPPRQMIDQLGESQFTHVQSHTEAPKSDQCCTAAVANSAFADQEAFVRNRRCPRIAQPSAEVY